MKAEVCDHCGRRHRSEAAKARCEAGVAVELALPMVVYDERTKRYIVRDCDGLEVEQRSRQIAEDTLRAWTLMGCGSESCDRNSHRR